MSVPCIKEVAARLIYAELSDHLSEYFASSEKFCSWLGICPGNKISANKSYSGAAAKGNKWLRRVLVECAQAIGLSTCKLKEQFMVFKLRRGTRRAVVAIAHLLTRIIFSVLTSGHAYVERGMRTVRDELVRKAERSIRELEHHDFKVRSGALQITSRETGEVIAVLPG